MRPAIYVAALLALAACAPVFVRAVLSGTAAIVLESLPYLLATALLAPVAGRYARPAVAFAGCGCGGPGAARSIPAALATAALFGPAVALARLIAGSLAGLRSAAHSHAHSGLGNLLAELVPAAVASAAVAAALPLVALNRLPGPAAFAAGAAMGAFAAPCALGAVALAAALHARAPAAAWGLLATAGIVDFSRRRHACESLGDPWAFGLLGAACAIVAWEHGAQLVHPRIALVLAFCAPVCGWLAVAARKRRSGKLRVIAAAVFLATAIGAPAPTYHATETTLSDGFAGERVTFNGVATSDGAHNALVRYAITCCRADAQPVVLAVDQNLRDRRGRWMRAAGVLTATPHGLQLHATQLDVIAPPIDPFVYR